MVHRSPYIAEALKCSRRGDEPDADQAQSSRIKLDQTQSNHKPMRQPALVDAQAGRPALLVLAGIVPAPPPLPRLHSIGGGYKAGGMASNEFKRRVPLAAWLVVVITLLLVPLKIIGYGYLPADDALRHAAKAVSGKPWSEILVMRNDFAIDQHP